MVLRFALERERFSLCRLRDQSMTGVPECLRSCWKNAAAAVLEYTRADALTPVQIEPVSLDPERGEAFQKCHAEKRLPHLGLVHRHAHIRKGNRSDG
jgi:hypothetical protein